MMTTFCATKARLTYLLYVQNVRMNKININCVVIVHVFLLAH